MKEIIIIGSDDLDGLLQILDNLKNVLKFNWEISMLDYDTIKLLIWDDSDSSRKYLIVNIDFHEKIDLSAYKGYHVITVGFNNKSSVTVSSVEDDGIVFCIQREIPLTNKTIEPQDIVVKNAFIVNNNILSSIFVFSIMFIIKEKDFENYF